MATTKLAHRSNTGIIIILVLAIVVVANILITLVSHHLRWDLTADSRFTLSGATKKILRELPDRVIVNVYISEEFPNGLIPAKRRLEELLAEYQSYAPTGYFNYKFTDPAKAVEPDKYEEFMRDLQAKGIKQATDRDVSKTGNVQLYRYVFGLSMEFRDKKPVVINVDSLQNHPAMEYYLTRSLKSLVTSEQQSVAFLKGDNYRDVTGSEEYKSFLNFMGEVKIPVRAATIRDQKVTPDDIGVLVIVGETDEMSQSDIFAVDQFVMKGGRLLVITEGVEPLQMQQSEMMKLYQQGINLLQPRTSPLAGMLKNYGIELVPGLLLDEGKCPREVQLRAVSLVDGQGRTRRGLAPVEVLIPYYALYNPENYNPDSILTQGLGLSIFITSSPIVTKENPVLGTEAVPLVYSSERTVLQNGAQIVVQRGGLAVKDWDALKARLDSGKYLLAAAMKGKFSSYFKGRPVPKPEPKKADPGEVDPMEALRGLPGARSSGGPPRRPAPPARPAPRRPQPPKPAPKKPAPSPEPPPAKETPEPGKQPVQPGNSTEGASGMDEFDIPGGGVAENPPPAEPPKAEPPNAELPKAEPPKAEPPKAEPPNVSGMPGLPPTPPGGLKPPEDETVVAPVKKVIEQSEWTQIAVISDVDFLIGGPRGPHFPPPPGPPRDGADYSWRLVRNILEWMLDDEEIVKIRSRGMQAQNLKSDITDGQRTTARIFAIGGVPILLVFAALGLWGMKRRRRRRLHEMESV